ncbi:MAG TPA: type VI secretion system tip protein TssI/VgrG [Verrucomicrobiae bacterium]|jgi:type VI secretion system secreted protein VgrG|nr:type VI secretion system tip protein TssI/VgrG [Verrucomicrobiae bacterium]
MALTQQNRQIAIGTPLTNDTLLITSFSGHEELGRLFEFQVEMSSDNFNIDFDKIIGGNVTIRLQTTTGGTRYFNGIVSRFTQHPSSSNYATYHATIVPWLWLLTRTSDCRIWSGADTTRTVKDIIKALFSARGFSDFDDSQLSGNYTPWEFCVQYRETDFNFLSRIMEQEGIYYYFAHVDGKHTLMLTDSLDPLKSFPNYDQISFRPRSAAAPDGEYVREWTLNKELHSGSFVHTDFDFTKPRSDLRTDPATISRQHDNATFEIFDYPGEFTAPGDGTQWSKIRIQELQSRYHLVHGQADCRGLAPGSTFTLEDLPRTDQNQKYVTVAVSHSIQSPGFESQKGAGKEFYSCSFSALPVTEIFRPARITPKPLIQGPQTAIIVGAKGDEICTDQYGRVKLKFHWDRYSNSDDKSSCFIRVSQAWAGKKWGAICLPRVGQEVIVEFLEGDPDQPIITGRVYNGDAMPPYALPGEMTKSTVKSNSSKGGQGFNEIRFEDKKGSEQVFIHAEHNMDTRVKNDAFENIGNNRHLVVTQDRLEYVKNNRHETVDNDHMEKIGADRNLNVVGKEAKSVGGNLSLTVKGDVIEVFKGNHSEVVSSDCYLKAANIVIEGTTNVTIKVGQSYIAIESGGISIGTTGTISLQDTQGLTIQSSASISMQDSAGLSIKSSAQAQIDSPLTTVKGDGMLTLKGGMVMIN